MEQGHHQEISIRLAQLADSDVIVELQLISIETLCAQDYSPEQLQALLDNKSCPRYWDENIFIAEIGELIVGFAALQKHSYVITAMFVHPQYIRQKVGTKLLLYIEKIATENKIKYLLVYSSLTGKIFYMSNGFTTIGTHNIILENKIILPSIKMRKRLLVDQDEKHSNKSLKREIINKSLLKILICLIILILLIL